MINKPQLPVELSAPEQDETHIFLLKSLSKLRVKEGLNPSDIREAEQLIYRYKTDIKQIRDGVEQLYMELDEFDPRQSKLANLYVELQKIIRDQAINSQTTTPGESTLKPLSIPLRPEAAREPESPITLDTQERMIGLLSAIRVEANE